MQRNSQSKEPAPMADDALTRKEAEMGRMTRERIEIWRVDLRKCFMPEISMNEIDTFCDLAIRALSLESVREEALRKDALLEALEEGYAVMADITNQWEGRHTVDGQKLLCKMRDAIASATGISGEDGQDNAISPLQHT